MLWWLVIVTMDANGDVTVARLRRDPFTDLAACEQVMQRQKIPPRGALSCMTHDDFIAVKEYHDV